MRRSKLETCLSILETLASHGSLKITHVMQKANLNCNVLKNYFDFLIKQGAVEEQCVEKDRIVYGITERGTYLIRYFRELNQVVPTMKISQVRSTKAIEGTYIELAQRILSIRVDTSQYTVFCLRIQVYFIAICLIVPSSLDSCQPISKYPFSTPIRLASVVHKAEVSSDVFFLVVEIIASLPSKTANLQKQNFCILKYIYFIIFTHELIHGTYKLSILKLMMFGVVICFHFKI